MMFFAIVHRNLSAKEVCLPNPVPQLDCDLWDCPGDAGNTKKKTSRISVGSPIECSVPATVQHAINREKREDTRSSPRHRRAWPDT